MKRSLPFIPVLLIPAIFLFSCQDKKDDSKKINQVLRIDCESMVAKCGNGPGLRLNGQSFGRWIERPGEEGDFERPPFHYIICCENVPAFIDKMKYVDSARRAWIRDKPDSMDQTYTLPGGTVIHVYYTKRFSDIRPDEFSFLSFGNPEEAPVFYIGLQGFEELMKDIEERFRTCCLE